MQNNLCIKLVQLFSSVSYGYIQWNLPQTCFWLGKEKKNEQTNEAVVARQDM